MSDDHRCGGNSGSTATTGEGPGGPDGAGGRTAGVWAINARTGDALGLASNNDRFLLSLLASPRSHAELRVWWPVRLKTSMRGTGGVHPSQPSRAGGEEGMCQLVGFALSDDTALEVDPVL